MTAEQIDTLLAYIDARLDQVDGRLAGVVAGQTTHMIDATKALVEGLYDEIRTTNDLVASLNEHDIAWRAEADRRMAATDARVAALAERVPGGTEALEAADPDAPTLRQIVEGHWRATVLALLTFGLLICLIEAAQWTYIARIVGVGG